VHRNHGYASNLVAALSQHQLNTGKRFCFLNTDLSNPTSNKIYAALGYRPVCEHVQIMFDRAGDGR
jgi:predicted GNAT family acetyltransferase